MKGRDAWKSREDSSRRRRVLSQRVERWLTRPLPKLERFVTTTTFRTHEDIWNDQRLARRARGQDFPSWLDVVQSDIDAYLFGEALRELRDVMKIFPDSPRRACF